MRGQIKLPTGDEKDLLGTGETDFELLMIASKTWKQLTPHVNLGYELSTGPSEFDNLSYAAGFEADAHRRLTVALDVLGRYSPHADSRANHLVDLAVGGRLNLWRSLLFNANVLIPLNDSRGLRAFVWTVGLEYSFGFGGG